MSENNYVVLIGRVAKDPEVKNLPNNKTVANFSICTIDTYLNKDHEVMENKEFHNIVAWGQQAKNIGFSLRKGIHLTVMGTLKNRSWEDQDGTKHYRTEILLEDMKITHQIPPK
jgi:single-strand DNA-binding protein